LEDDVTNAEQQGILFPWKYVSDSAYAMPDFAYIHRELAKNGVTLTLLWEEYCTKVRSNGSVPYSYTQFGEKWLVTEVVSHIFYMGKSSAVSAEPR
jgi:hypothetical protein